MAKMRWFTGLGDAVTSFASLWGLGDAVDDVLTKITSAINGNKPITLDSLYDLVGLYIPTNELNRNVSKIRQDLQSILNVIPISNKQRELHSNKVRELTNKQALAEEKLTKARDLEAEAKNTIANKYSRMTELDKVSPSTIEEMNDFVKNTGDGAYKSFKNFELNLRGD